MSGNNANWLDGINLKVELIPADRPNRPGTHIRPTYVTIHNTDNTDKGADANANSTFVRYEGNYEHNGKIHWVSWHYTVDDRIAIRQLPDNEKGWHAGANGNRSSIAIEICMQQGIDQPAANERAARLAAYLLVEHNLAIGALATHKHWTGKQCPSLLLAGTSWADFVAMVDSYMLAMTGRTKDGVAVRTADPFRFRGGMCWMGHEE